MFHTCLPFFHKTTTSRINATPVNPIIKQATDQDKTCLQKLAKQTREETYHRPYDPRYNLTLLENFDQSNHIIFIARLKNQPIGFAKLILHDHHAYLDKIYVVKRYHGNQVGSGLLMACCEATLAANLQIMRLEVWDSNDQAIAFYKKKHFKTIETNIPYHDFDGQLLGYDNMMQCDDVRLILGKRQFLLNRLA